MKIVYVHLLNDFSGSPRVLRDVIDSAPSMSDAAILYIGSGDGFLSDCGVDTRRFGYRRSKFKVVTLFAFIVSQISLFFKLLVNIDARSDTLIYVNTLLPFGAGLFGWLRGVRVVYHIHEVSITPRLLRAFLMFVVRRSSSLNIYVSQAHMAALPIRDVPAVFVHNGLSADFRSVAATAIYNNRSDGKFRVLMIASLKGYKGLDALIELAFSTLDRPDIEYDLVANADWEIIHHWMGERNIPTNLTVHGRTADTGSFYRRSDVVLNLSRVDQWVETFGLTVLEAMSFGIPVIVPPVGGPAELVSDGIHGFLVDSRDGGELNRRLMQLYASSELCLTMSRNSRLRSAQFSSEAFASGIAKALQLS